jgi:hypothetical protein
MAADRDRKQGPAAGSTGAHSSPSASGFGARGELRAGGRTRDWLPFAHQGRNYEQRLPGEQLEEPMRATRALLERLAGCVTQRVEQVLTSIRQAR